HSQVPCRIHHLVQDPNHVHAVRPRHVEQQVPADAVLTVSVTEFVARPPTSRIISDAFDGRPDVHHIDLSLTDVPALRGVVPDRGEIQARGRCQAIAGHDFFAAMNASKSKGSGAPLSSPATRAARNAATRVSWSSSNRRPARTTSLAER